MLIDCSRDNPFRPAHWRWLRAMGIANGEQPRATRRLDGPNGFRWIKRAAKFKQAYDACENDAARRVLANQMPDMFWAHQCWLETKKPTRWHIEAAILARQDDWEIGFACGVNPEIVDAFESVFFNVREKLNHRHYILHHVIGPAVQRGLYERDYDVLWKLYGFFYGPHALDALASKFLSPNWCSTPDTVNSSYQDDAIGTLKMKAAIAAKTIPVTLNTQVDLLHIFTKFVEVERTTDSAGKAQDQMLEHISAMMGNMPFNIGGRDPQRQQLPVEPNPAHAYKQTNIELSFEETMMVATGGEVPTADRLVELTFPPPPGLEEDAGGTNEED